MKKTLKFDDGSVLVGSSSTFTVTQEDQGEVDIFDMPSQYIYVADYNSFQDIDYNKALYAVENGDKQKSVLIEVLEPFKINNVKCKVIGKWVDEDYAYYWTDTEDKKHYELYYGEYKDRYYQEDNIKTLFVIRDLGKASIDLSWKMSLETVDFNNKTVSGVQFTKCQNLKSVLNNANVKFETSDTFSGCGSLTEITDLNSIFSSGTQFFNTFDGCKSLVLDLSNTTCTPEYCSKMFYQCNSIQEYDLTNWDMTKCKNAGYMFGDFYQNSLATKIKFGPKCTFENCFYFTRMFVGMPKLTDCDISMFNFGKAENMKGLFVFSHNITNINNDYSTLSNSIKEIGNIFPNAYNAPNVIFSILGDNIQYMNDIENKSTIKIVMPSKLTNMLANQLSVGAADTDIIIWKNFGASKNVKEVSISCTPKSEEGIQAFKEIFSGAFDRKAAGYPVQTVRTYIYSGGVQLTGEEITAFQNKGYIYKKMVN